MGNQFRQALYIFLIVCSFGASQSGKLRHTRAINGEPALSGEFPYTVILTDEDGFLHCGGVLISTQTVLTTALCLEGYEDVSEVYVRLGTNRWAGGEGDEATFVQAIVDEAIPHPEFDSSEIKNDIALLTLYAPVTLSAKVGVACLSSSNDHVGQNATFSGWGYLEGGGHNEVLHKLDLEVISLPKCEELLNDFTFDNTTICSFSPTKDICAGDQGGPLVTRKADSSDTVIGVASWTTCTAGVPAVFANVGSHIDWIKKNIAGEFACFD